MAILASTSPAPARPSASEPPKLTWTRPAEDLWVATTSSKFAGEVRQRSDVFSVSDQTGKRVGEFSTLPTAMNALRRADHLSVRGVLRRDALGQAAVTIGLLAVAVAVVAVAIYFR